MNETTDRLKALQTQLIDHLSTEAKNIGETGPVNLYQPIEYTLNMGGKRLRPVMVLLANELFGGNPEDAMNAALAVEIFHNFTLLHDDIMDNADMRRNKPSVHKKYSENIAILSGDAMSIMAYRYLLKTKAARLNEIISLFTETAIEVCEGQQYDMDFENRLDVTVEEYLEMIRLKTAVLLACSFKMGALSANASNSDAENIYQFGINLGLAFQLQDDLLDCYADQDKFGKRIGGDIVANKKTFLLINAMELASEKLKPKLTDWLQQDSFDEQEKIAAVKAIYQETGVKEICEKAINDYYNKALISLEQIGIDENKKTILQLLAKSIMEREH
ncbi:polyprenyl synthetase family protein [Mangrovibacterium diazotrophicum]|uniref:Geranylgeranyl diphosphate synthase type II n=1 Tax=Mangrovibacterium diazotrophicum TaxID=1261403 RepID=A0A419W8T2_9BACT|nr:polyprenyl synthetase family protein [Mangrovibacterium diazotrophicum]RKD91881.1 geranylgeranyl diphosphate synthase type II [Mangrovibacterium diazotrophicum]